MNGMNGMMAPLIGLMMTYWALFSIVLSLCSCYSQCGCFSRCDKARAITLNTRRIP